MYTFIVLMTLGSVLYHYMISDEGEYENDSLMS